MKKAVKKVQTPTYFRYEFSDEAGCPEGGDIFQFSSTAQLQKMMKEVLSVAQHDEVTVSLTVGKGEHFFKFLKNTGLSQKEVEAEMVDETMIPLLADKKTPKAKTARKKPGKSSKSS